MRWVRLAVVALLTGPALVGGPAKGADDPLRRSQWALERIELPDGGPDGGGITVAVVDTGVDAAHEDLAGQVIGAADCVGAQGDPSACRAGAATDDDGHGTHVAGIIAARRGNGTGISGVAPGARLLAVRVLQRSCEAPGSGLSCRATGTVADAEAGIRWAVASGADVVNLSLTADAIGATGTTPLAAAVHEAWERGVIVVAAAGNDFGMTLGEEWDSLPLLVVTATTADDGAAPYANGTATAPWALAAPGGAASGSCPAATVVSTTSRALTGERYGCMWGTSMAAPHAAGAAALLRSAGLGPAATVDRLLETAADLGPVGPDSTFGAGRLNVGRALRDVQPPRPAGPPTRTVGAAGAAPSPSPGEDGRGRPLPAAASGRPSAAPADAGASLLSPRPSTGAGAGAMAPPAVGDLLPPANPVLPLAPGADGDGGMGGPELRWLLMSVAVALLAAVAAAVATRALSRAR